MGSKDKVSGTSKVRKRERQLYLYSGCDQASAIPRTCLRSARPHHPSEYTQACPSNPHVPMGAKGRKPSPWPSVFTRFLPKVFILIKLPFTKPTWPVLPKLRTALVSTVQRPRNEPQVVMMHVSPLWPFAAATYTSCTSDPANSTCSLSGGTDVFATYKAGVTSPRSVLKSLQKHTLSRRECCLEWGPD